MNPILVQWLQAYVIAAKPQIIPVNAITLIQVKKNVIHNNSKRNHTSSHLITLKSLSVFRDNKYYC